MWVMIVSCFTKYLKTTPVESILTQNIGHDSYNQFKLFNHKLASNVYDSTNPTRTQDSNLIKQKQHYPHLIMIISCDLSDNTLGMWWILTIWCPDELPDTGLRALNCHNMLFITMSLTILKLKASETIS